MKLTNNKKTSTSHNGKDSKDDKDSIYKQIADEFGAQISLMLTIVKNDENTRYSFFAPGKISRMAGIIAAKVSVVKTVSDVYRAAVYLGVSIIYNMLLKNPTEEISCYFDQCAEGDNIIQQVQLIERASYLVSQYYSGFQAGIIDEKKLKEKTDILIRQLPKGLQKIAQKDIDQILNGVPFARISSLKRVGRPTKMIEYNDD